MVSCILFLTLVSISGFDPPLQMPSQGIGSETVSEGVRSFSMGGVSAGIPDSGMVSIANPSASAWAGTTGFSFGARVRDTEDPSWSEASDFPDVSVMMSLPLGVQLSGVLSGRSRLNSTDSVFFENGSGTIHWSGSTAESYLGATLKASNNFAFSLGGRCFFGSALGDAVTNRESPGPYVPVTLPVTETTSLSYSSWGLISGRSIVQEPFPRVFHHHRPLGRPLGSAGLRRPPKRRYHNALLHSRRTLPGDIGKGSSQGPHRGRLLRQEGSHPAGFHHGRGQFHRGGL